MIDTETTGLSCDWDHLIKVVAVRFLDGEEVARLSSLIQPPRNWVVHLLMSSSPTSRT